MSNFTLANSFLQSLRCHVEDHQNKQIEFICDLPGCDQRLTCLSCLLNDHSSHFVGMSLISNFFNRQASSSDDSKTIKKFPGLQLHHVNIEETENKFNRQLEIQKLQIIKELKSNETKFKMKISELLQAIEFSRDSTLDKFNSKVKSIIQSNQTHITKSTPKCISNKIELETFLNSKFSKKTEKAANDDVMETLISLQIMSVNPVSINGPIHSIVNSQISSKLAFSSINDSQLEFLAFARMKAFSPKPNTNFKELKEEKTITTKHKKPIYKLVFFENESKFATASDDSNILLWNSPTYEVYATLSEHTDRVWNIILLGSDRLASGSSDNKIKLWNLKSQKCERTLLGHNGYVCALMEFPCNLLISGSQDNRMKVWNTVNGGCVSTIKAEGQGKIMCLAWVTHSLLAVGSNSNINVYDFAKGKVEYSLEGHTALVRDLLLMDCLDVLLSSSDDHHIISWSIVTRGQLMKFTGHTLSANKLLAWSDECFVSAGDDGKINFWNINSSFSRHEHSIVGGKSWITSITTRSDGALISVGADKVIKIWK